MTATSKIYLLQQKNQLSDIDKLFLQNRNQRYEISRCFHLFLGLNVYIVYSEKLIYQNLISKGWDTPKDIISTWLNRDVMVIYKENIWHSITNSSQLWTKIPINFVSFLSSNFEVWRCQLNSNEDQVHILS